MSKRLKRNRRGIALLMVMSVIAVTAVLGFAMLSGASLQAQTERNASNGASTDALIDSGIDLACYYLINPHKAPSLTNGFWAGGNSISLGAGVPALNVAVTNLATNTYQITVSAASSAGVTSRSSKATVVVTPGLKVKHAAAFNAAIATIPSSVTVNGDTQGAATVVNYGVLRGKLYSTAYANFNVLQGGWSLLTASNKATVPTSARLRSYATYTWRGRTFTAATLGDTLGSGTFLQPSSTNPAGIFRRVGNLSIPSNVTINWTLIVEGELNVNGSNSVITAQEGYPAPVVKNDLYLRSGIQRELTCYGLSWVGSSIRSSGIVLIGNLNFVGALQFGGSGQVDWGYVGRVTSTYDADSVANVNLDTLTPAAGVEFSGFTN